MRIQPTFTARHFANKSVVLICRETGDRYSFSEAHPFDSTPVFRNGEVMGHRRGKAPILGLIESDARWAIREAVREQKQHDKGVHHFRPTANAIWL